MDEETKKFFTELSSSAQEINKEVEAEFVKSSPVTARRKEQVGSDVVDDIGELTIDIYQTPDEIIIEAPIAGVSDDDIDVAIGNDTVTIKGARERKNKVKGSDVYLEECFWGKFERQITLPQEIDAENASAAMEKGVLVVHLPKLKKEKSKKLKVRAG